MLEKLTIDRKKAVELLYAGALSGVAVYFHDYPFWIQAIVDWLQFTLIFALLLLAIKDHQTYSSVRSNREAKALSQFLRFWKHLWFVWLMLYLIFAVNNTFRAIHSESQEASALSTGDIRDWEMFCAELSNRTIGVPRRQGT